MRRYWQPALRRRPTSLTGRLSPPLALALWIALWASASGHRLLAQTAEPRWAAPPLEKAVSARDGRTDKVLTLSGLLDELAAADVVFVGESHTDETTHRVEMAIYEGLLERRGGRVTLAMEMFERDTQAALDAYLKGEIDESAFLKQARPWSNYSTAYRPLVELAKQRGGSVVASNFPRPLIARLGAEGAKVLDSLPPETRAQAPETLLPNPESYWRRVDNAIRGHAGMMRETDRLYSTQSLWDNAMGESCAKALDRFPESSVLHINGDFHSSYWEGTVHQLRQRKPNARIKTVSVVPVTHVATAKLEGEPSADFVVFAEGRATDVNEGRWSVHSQREMKYVLHLPPDSVQRPVPLVIVLVDDGLTATDGLDYWKDQIGAHAAIAVLEPPYKETQSDLGIGGRWFWNDSFPSDLGTAVGCVEEVWAYLMRHYPIDAKRVVVLGEGTGGTVAASVGLLTQRIDVTAIAHSPRHYAKLKDFPLPLPESWGTDRPPDRSIVVHVGDERDEAWWTPELKAYTDVGVVSSLERLDTDPWIRDGRFIDGLRTRLGIPSTERPGALAYLLLENDGPRARQWARMQAIWIGARDGYNVAVVRERPADSSAVPISTELRPENLASPGAVPRCPGPFGGTTVLVLPPDMPEQDARDWFAVEENDPLAKQSRFHRVRIATADGERDLPSVLAKLLSENRKNILIVPAAFHASEEWLRSLEQSARGLGDQLSLQWQPGLGGSKAAFAGPHGTRADGPPLRHDLKVTLEPSKHELSVEDHVALPRGLRAAGTVFTLNRGLTIQSSSVPLTRLEPADDEPVTSYKLAQDANGGTLVITYAGTMNFGLSDPKEEYTRGFRDTRGIVGGEGVYLDAKSAWIPSFDERLIGFKLQVALPDQWHVISQGKGTSRDEHGMARWESDGPMEEVYLVGGALHRETETAGAVEIAVYLREPDESLARKYLDTGARYLEMYRELIGTYPYAKFALVENFWETGYGMPSFSLLGPQVIRFPFILHSSYPHEILHNWWGNSVFVDYSQGNWCEGLTAYMADHLIQEQRGAGAEYRRNTLQRYRDYVREGRDFPLAEFQSRHNAATEAVGYGKSLMLFHMLRRDLGDERFKKGLSTFYAKYRGSRATFDDLRQVMEGSGESPLGPFFAQWLERTGAPRLELRDVAARPNGAGFLITGSLEQTQDGTPYDLTVPIVVQMENGQTELLIATKGTSTPLRIEIEHRPLVMAVDPSFDLFRQLDPRETPPTIGQIFGQPKVLAVLPAAEDEATLTAWRELVESWRSDEHTIDVVLDKDLAELPRDQAAWVLGGSNRFAPEVLRDHAHVALAADGATIKMGADQVAVGGHSLIVMRRHAHHPDLAVGWIAIDPREAFEGIARKLPHYGKYSYLAFEGKEPTNTVKGQFDTTGSPLVIDLREDRSAAARPMAPIDRKALAELPPAFSGKVLREHVAWLAAPEREGRGLGSTGLAQSADYIAQAMASAGLKPAGDNGTWFQKFTVAKGPDGVPVETMNVVGVLPGKRAEWQSQSIIVSAHYDHLGRGWPDVHAGDEGKVHPGADDNASGVGIMLELARVLGEEGGGSRNLVFIAFSAEECGRLGSQHYVSHSAFPAPEIRAVINMDTVGRLQDGPISVLGTGTADEWQHVFRGCTFVTGIPSKNIPEATSGSDQMSFIERGIPGVQIFSGANADYHRPTDTLDKIDSAGMVKVATFVKEAITYLLERDPPLTVTIAGQTTRPAPASSDGGRRVVFGAVPAFDYQGEGVKFDSMVADSPAARAGLLAGDILVELGGGKIADLRAFSETLKKLEPGQTVVAKVLREGAPKQFSVTVEKR